MSCSESHPQIWFNLGLPISSPLINYYYYYCCCYHYCYYFCPYTPAPAWDMHWDTCLPFPPFSPPAPTHSDKPICHPRNECGGHHFRSQNSPRCRKPSFMFVVYTKAAYVSTCVPEASTPSPSPGTHGEFC